MMAAGAITFLLASGATGLGFVLGVVGAFALGWGWPGLMTYAVVNANTDAAASSSAVTQAGIFLGAGLGPVALGWVIDALSYEAAFVVVAVALVAASLTVATVAYQRRSLDPRRG